MINRKIKKRGLSLWMHGQDEQILFKQRGYMGDYIKHIKVKFHNFGTEEQECLDKER